MIPDLSALFDSIKKYRYSITVGIVLLYFTPMLFPVGWETASATWRYGVATMFFLSVGMILSRDLWPKIKQLFGFGVNKKKVSFKILKACKNQGGDPPFELKISNIDTDKDKIKDLIDGHFSYDECRISEEILVVTKKGLKRLKKNI